MPATKKKAPAAKRAQSKQTKSKTGVARLLPKKGFQVWSAALIVVLVAAIGYSVVRYSQASNNIAQQCYALHTKSDPNPTNKCVATDFVSGATGDLITISDFPGYKGFTGTYTNGDQICVDIMHKTPPRIVVGGSQASSGQKGDGTTDPVYAPTPKDQVSVAITLKSNPATRKVLTTNRYGQTNTSAGFKCVPLVGEGWASGGPVSYDYRDAINTPGGIQVKVLQGPIDRLRVFVSPSGDRPEGDGPDVFGTESR